MKNTDTPWLDVGNPSPTLATIELDGDGVIRIYGEDAKAVAAIIVRAVNAHDALVSACSTLIQVVEQLIPEPSARGVADLVLFQARVALGQAHA